MKEKSFQIVYYLGLKIFTLCDRRNDNDDDDDNDDDNNGDNLFRGIAD